MTSSIFLPRRSRAWLGPSTHLMESTMFVLPEPLGPTMAVTPPSNWISVCRAKVLKPSNCRDLRNKLAGRVPDVGGGGRTRHQSKQCAGIWLFGRPRGRIQHTVLLTGWVGTRIADAHDSGHVPREIGRASTNDAERGTVFAPNCCLAAWPRRSGM